MATTSTIEGKKWTDRFGRPCKIEKVYKGEHGKKVFRVRKGERYEYHDNSTPIKPMRVG